MKYFLQLVKSLALASRLNSWGVGIIVLLASLSVGSGRQVKDVKNIDANSVSSGFIENRGQIVDQNSVPNPDVRYLFNSNGCNVQLRATGFSYDTYFDEEGGGINNYESLNTQYTTFTKRHSINRHFHRVDVELKGCNFGAELQASDENKSYENYYLNELSILNERSYRKVVYKEIYSSIDLEFFISADGTIEYQFVVRPGGNVQDIRLEYIGANSTSLYNGKVRFYVENGVFEEYIPLSYLKENKEVMDVSVVAVGDNEYGYQVKSPYHQSHTLIIDPKPVRAWGTYYGGAAEEQGYSTAVDGNGNVYVCGFTLSTSNIASSGSHQVTIGANTDAFIAKFNSTGIRQ